MSAFQTPLMMTPVAGAHGSLWLLDAPLVYQSDVARVTYIVPAGFSCDLNSMPRVLWGVSPKTDYPEAGALHDFLYRTQAPKDTADRVYREALQVLGMSAWRAASRYYALKFFGGGAYSSNALRLGR